MLVRDIAIQTCRVWKTTCETQLLEDLRPYSSFVVIPPPAAVWPRSNSDLARAVASNPNQEYWWRHSLKKRYVNKKVHFASNSRTPRPLCANWSYFCQWEKKNTRQMSQESSPTRILNWRSRQGGLSRASSFHIGHAPSPKNSLRLRSKRAKSI
jgi:hypothetical protein